MNEAGSADTPYGRYITSEGWFVLDLEDALAVRNAESNSASSGRATPLDSATKT
jgi:hypothetical protein